MMLTTEFLKSNGLDALCAQHAIYATRGKEFPNLVLLKYNQIEAVMSEPIVQECRGLIVDEADDWRVVCRPYDKFFNSHEGHAAAIDWSTATVYEKLDGSLMTLYPYRGEWRVSSSGIPDASGPATGSLTFADLFWRTWKQLGYDLPGEYGEDLCYMFELMTPHNRVLVCHEKPRLVLHGVRDLQTFKEISPEACAAPINWECVRSFPLGCIDACLAAAKELDPMCAEGYVVRDAQFRRIKVKSPQYVALAHLKDGMSGRRLLDIVRSNESDEFLSYFPEWTHAYGLVRAAFDSLCADLESSYSTLRNITEQKSFALEALKTRCASPLFAMRKGCCQSVKEFFKDCMLPALEKVIGMDLSTVVLESQFTASEQSK